MRIELVEQPHKENNQRLHRVHEYIHIDDELVMTHERVFVHTKKTGWTYANHFTDIVIDGVDYTQQIKFYPRLNKIKEIKYIVGGVFSTKMHSQHICYSRTGEKTVEYYYHGENITNTLAMLGLSYDQYVEIEHRANNPDEYLPLAFG